MKIVLEVAARIFIDAFNFYWSLNLYILIFLLLIFHPNSFVFISDIMLSPAPRIGNTVFAAFVNRKIPSNYRVEVDTDIITMIPKVLGLYRHAGIPVVIDSDETGP